MKRLFTIMGLVAFVLLFSGCKSDSMENIQIYTSVYPIQYVTERIYGDYASIHNIYPQGINPYDYKLTDKQISDYSDCDLMIYNGQSSERDLIVEMLNKNNYLKIIDATNKIDIQYHVDEIWINPSNMLMIAKNIKDGLNEYVVSDIIKSNIDKNYEKIRMDISSLDASLKEMALYAKENKLIVSSNQFEFLEKYGLNVISLDDTTYTDKIFSDASDAASSGEIKYIYLKKNEEPNDNIKRLKESYPSLEYMYIDTLNNITTNDKKEGNDYITIMNDNIDKLKQELY